MYLFSVFSVFLQRQVRGLLLLKVVRHSGVEGSRTIDYFSGRGRWSALEWPGRIYATGPKAYKYSVPVRCRIGIKSFLAFK
jgi:hypothetical protein